MIPFPFHVIQDDVTCRSIADKVSHMYDDAMILHGRNSFFY